MDYMTPTQQETWLKHFSKLREKVLRKKPIGDELVRWKYATRPTILPAYGPWTTTSDASSDHLDQTSLGKNTVVIYASDQGFFLGEHGWFDKRFMYEESLRTPLLVRWPGISKPGTVAKEIVSNLDFAQTLLDIAGAPIPDMQGRSLKPILTGNTDRSWRTAHHYHYYCYPEHHAVRRHDGIRTDRYKLIHYYDLQEWELFDLKNDPHEMRSLHFSEAHAEVLKNLKDQLGKLRKQYEVTDPPPLRTGNTLFPPLKEFGTFLIEY